MKFSPFRRPNNIEHFYEEKNRHAPFKSLYAVALIGAHAKQ